MGRVVHRRSFITLLGGVAVSWAQPLRAQQPGKRAHIGVLSAGRDNPIMGPAYSSFLDEMRRLGFEENRNLTVDHRPTDQDPSTVSLSARELASFNVDALVALGAEPSLKACISASRKIPIVFVANNFDPIAL